MWIFLIAISYIFFGGFFGSLTTLKLAPGAGIRKEAYSNTPLSLGITTGIFWPIVMLIWAGYFAAKSLEE